MSKRLVRLNPEIIFRKLENVTELEINAVLQNGRTYFGKIKSVTSDYVVLADTRDHVHRIAIADLYEIVYDMESIKAIALP